MTDIVAQIDELLAEPIAAAAERERITFDALLRETDGGVVLFGAGRLGQLCARALRRGGIPLYAFCDGNRELHGATREGAAVLAPADAARRFGANALFVVTIWTGTAGESMRERLTWLRRLGCRHVTAYPPLVWAWGRDETPFHSFDLPTRILARAVELRRLAGLLGDDESQQVLLAALRQRLRGEFDDQPPTADQYFPSDLVRLRNDEVVADGGAFDGDTLDDFLRRTQGAFAAYHAFEPDTANRQRLRQRIAAHPAAMQAKIAVHSLALHDREEELNFASLGGHTSQVAAAGTARVAGRPLDTVLGEARVTFLKLDVEGAERAALDGAKKILRQHRPLVAACVYHGPTDLWEIPLWLQEWLPNGQLFLRQHGFDGWETVCYAIPTERLPTWRIVGARPAELPPSITPARVSAVPRPCPICESTGPREVLHQQRFFEGPLGDGYDVVVCGECGAGFADGVPVQEELDRYYAERSKYTYAHAGGAESPYDFRRFERIADQIEPHLPSKEARILDIGCATGGLLAVLKRRGYVNVLGSDPSPACAEAAQRLHGVEVRPATLREHAEWGERFDMVLLVGVLEHLREVRQAVDIATGLLGPTGLLYCAQPDVEAFGECDNAPYQQFSTEHVNFFSRESLSRLMAVSGLTPRDMWRWMVEWREGVTDSAVSGVFARGQGVAGIDRVTKQSLTHYLAVSASQEDTAVGRIEKFVRTQEPLLVWGAGTLTRRLLATTKLERANIIAFVDANPALSGGSLAGRPVWSPADLNDHATTILIGSRVFEAEIHHMVRQQLRLPNPIRSLYSPEVPAM